MSLFRATGNPKTDLVLVAASQVGYHEGNSRSELGGGNTSGTANYTEYAYWFGPRVRGDSNFWYAWCAMFISWCARQAGIPESMINNSSMATCSGNPSLSGSYAFHIEKKTKDTYTPQAGDMILMHPVKETAEVLGEIIDGLRERGLEPCRVSDVVNIK